MGYLGNKKKEEGISVLYQRKNSYCTRGTLFGAIFGRNLPNADVKFSFCREAVAMCCENAL